MSELPSIQTPNSRKPTRSISFELKGKGNYARRSLLEEYGKLPEDVSRTGSHGNTTVKDKTKSFKEIMGHLDKKEQGQSSQTQKHPKGETQMYQRKVNGAVFGHIVQSLHKSLDNDKGSKTETSDSVDEKFSKMLREKDREIAALREIIRKASLDRENATCADAHSRMRITELKHKLSTQRRHVEHVTAVERLRCKEKVSNETERLRHERDDARVQLEHNEKLVWQLRKQVEQLGYLSRQR